MRRVKLTPEQIYKLCSVKEYGYSSRLMMEVPLSEYPITFFRNFHDTVYFLSGPRIASLPPYILMYIGLRPAGALDSQMYFYPDHRDA